MNQMEFMNQLSASVTKLTGVQIPEENQHEAILEALATVQPIAERMANVEDLVLEAVSNLDAVKASLPQEIMSAENVKSIALEVIGESGKAIQTSLEAKITQVSKDFGAQLLDLQERAVSKETGEHLDTGVDLNEKNPEVKSVQRKIGGKTIEVRPS